MYGFALRAGRGIKIWEPRYVVCEWYLIIMCLKAGKFKIHFWIFVCILREIIFKGKIFSDEKVRSRHPSAVPKYLYTIFKHTLSCNRNNFNVHQNNSYEEQNVRNKSNFLTYVNKFSPFLCNFSHPPFNITFSYFT